jgi:hypothetical protein
MKGFLKRICAAVPTFIRLVRNPEAQTYYPHEKRKSRSRIIWDNLVWLIRHGEINHFYYLYGFDRADFNRPEDYFPEQAFCRIRDRANAFYQIGPHRARYICLLQDKFLFGQYVSSLGFPTPPIYALCDEEGLYWIAERRMETWDQLPSHAPLDGFLKDALGRCGRAVYPLRLEEGRIFLNDREISGQELQKKIEGKYILQQRVVQHPEMSRMYPHSINTLRLITLRKGSRILPASGTFRIGAGGNRFDNWAGGGIGVGLDIRTGRLQEEGTFRLGFGGRVKAHPETKVVFRTFEIPYFAEAVDLVCRLHGFFYGVHSIGWDIAITEQGPVVIEGNNSWDIAFQQFHDSRIKQVFLDSLKNE